MPIEKNTVVSFHYTLKEENGRQLETSIGGEPSLYLHGAGNIIPGLEDAMAGREAGEHFTVTLEPHQAYGPLLPDRQKRMPAKHLKHEGRLQPGKVVRFSTEQGQRTATVVKVGKFSVDVDLNHPLAGRTLTFDISIDEIRPATKDEIAHGHAHGPGGHHHD